jgi:NADPH:quinone reductase-like Zn-dependent oxidoreductase
MNSNSWQFDAHGAPGEVLCWREQELPEPGPGQAWVKINAIGINLSDREIYPTASRNQEQALQGFTQQEIQTLISFLERIQNNIEPDQ